MGGSRCGTASGNLCVAPLICTSWGYCVCPSAYEGDGRGGCAPMSQLQMPHKTLRSAEMVNETQEMNGTKSFLLSRCL